MPKPKSGRRTSLNCQERFVIPSHNGDRLDSQESAAFEIETAYAEAFITPVRRPASGRAFLRRRPGVYQITFRPNWI